MAFVNAIDLVDVYSTMRAQSGRISLASDMIVLQNSTRRLELFYLVPAQVALGQDDSKTSALLSMHVRLDSGSILVGRRTASK
jgi:hypothetical protein